MDIDFVSNASEDVPRSFSINYSAHLFYSAFTADIL